MGKCEQAGLTQGSPVLEILPDISKFSELCEFFISTETEEKGRKDTPSPQPIPEKKGSVS